MCVCVYVLAHVCMRSPTHSCRRNAKRGQDQLDSIAFIGKKSTVTFVKVNFNPKTLTFGGGMVCPDEGQDKRAWSFPNPWSEQISWWLWHT